MKKFLALLLGLSVVISTCAFAEEIKQVTTETVFYIKAVHTLPENALSNFSVFSQGTPSEKQEQLVSFLKSCQPYNENININLFGFDATLNIHSDGKTNDKCTYELTGKINKIPEQLVQGSQYPLSDYMAFEPKVNCAFTQEQLNTLVDAFAESINEFNSENANVSRSAAKQHVKNKLANNEKLISVFRDSKACTLSNLSEL